MYVLALIETAMLKVELSEFTINNAAKEASNQAALKQISSSIKNIERTCFLRAPETLICIKNGTFFFISKTITEMRIAMTEIISNKPTVVITVFTISC